MTIDAKGEAGTVPVSPAKQRPIQLLRDTVSMLSHFIWHRHTRPGDHLWSIPADRERDWDFILSDAIDELEQLRPAAPVVSAPAEPQQAVRFSTTSVSGGQPATGMTMGLTSPVAATFDIARGVLDVPAAPADRPETPPSIETLKAHIEHMEEELDNVKFVRALNRAGAEALGKTYDDSDETPMPYVRVFEDDIIALRGIATALSAALPAPSGDGSPTTADGGKITTRCICAIPGESDICPACNPLKEASK